MRKTLLTLALLATFGLTACATTTPEGLTRADMQVISSVHRKVTENWLAMPYIDSEKRSSTVKISLSPKGEITHLATTKSSGNVNFDNGLLLAIRQAAPFQIPSANKGGQGMTYELTFTK